MLQFGVGLQRLLDVCTAVEANKGKVILSQWRSSVSGVAQSGGLEVGIVFVVIEVDQHH